MTIFVGVAAGFGFFGVKNILSIGETESAMKERYKNFQSKEKLLTEKVETIEKNLKDISSIFNNVSIANNKILSAREQQLLMFLAKEINPKSPLLKYNYAVSAYGFGRYNDALQFLSEIDFNNIQTNNELNIAWAKDLKRICEEAKASPPKVPPEIKPPKGSTIDRITYWNGKLFINIVDSLVTGGYLNNEQASKIFEDANQQTQRTFGSDFFHTW